MVNNKSLIQELRVARNKLGQPSYKVTLGKSVATLRSMRVDISQLSTYIVGMPDMGKSNLLARLFLENPHHSKILIDPQGKLTNELILPNIQDPSQVIYFAPYDQRGRPLAFNPFDLGKSPTKDDRDAWTGSLRSIFSHLWLDSYRNYPVMAMVFQNALNLLAHFEGMTFLDLARLLIDKGFRARLAYQIDDENLRDFWLKHYTPDMGISAYNKINEFVQIGIVRRVVCQRRSSFYLEEAMSQGKTVIVNLGGLQENATSLLGALFVSRVLAELIRREPIPTRKLTPFALFVDEFDQFGVHAFEIIISKCRQQKSSVCIAHQHSGQLNAGMKQSVLQSAYVVAFQVDPVTAKDITGVFQPQTDLVNVPRHHAWIRITGKKTGSVPEVDLIKTWPVSPGDPAMAEKIKHLMWPLGRSVEKVDAEIAESYKIIQRHNVTREETHASPEQIQPTGAKHLPRTQADWPARFRFRPSVVFDGLGK